MKQPGHVAPVIKRTLKVRPKAYHPSESNEQQTVVAWARMMVSKEPRLRWLAATNNGVPLAGPRRFAVVNFLKAMGMNKGIPDLILFARNGVVPGWAAEMKHKDWKGKLPDDEEDWRTHLRMQGWTVLSPCCGAAQAIASLKVYLEMKG